MPYLNDIYGTRLSNGATYGVGMVAVVHFDEQIPDKAAAEKAMSVTTTPHVDGAWYWTDDQTAHWRPQALLHARHQGHRRRQGLRRRLRSRPLRPVRREHVVHHRRQARLDRQRPDPPRQGLLRRQARAHDADLDGPGRLPSRARTARSTCGRCRAPTPSSTTRTRRSCPRTATACRPARRTATRRRRSYWSTKISTDGIYLHELDTTVWAQGHQNVSHGCLNLNYTNAKWFYKHSPRR